MSLLLLFTLISSFSFNFKSGVKLPHHHHEKAFRNYFPGYLQCLFLHFGAINIHSLS